MIVAPLVKQLLSILWWLLPLFILLFVLKTPWFKGLLGEFIVNTAAKWMLNKDDYHLIKNVTLPTEDGTTQIDHVIVSVFGVFVVETKNMKGWIFGSADQSTWTQKIFKVTNKFQNPLHQNYKHVKTLQTLLGLGDHQIFSVVVFVGDSTFKTEMPLNVTYGAGYIRYIKSQVLPVLSVDDVKTISQKIESGRLEQAFKTNREHVKHVKSIIEEKKSSADCPKCGSRLVKRMTRDKTREFMGCSGYPKCRHIQPIQGLLAKEGQ